MEGSEEAKAAARLARKQAKRARRAADAAAAPEQPAAAAEAAEPAAPPKKKKLKRAEAPGAAAAEPPTRAAVGDAAAADSKAPVRKAFYTQAAALAALSEAEVAALRASLSVSVESACPAPVRSFDEAGFPPAVRAACAGFAQPSPIQAQAWPVLLSGRDLVGIAATGSGKTLAFLLPGFVHIAAQPRSGAGEPVALVLAPTRELAMQTAEVAAATGAACGVRSVCVYGGAPKGPQQAALRGGASLVVATPGRLQDLHDSGAVSFARISYLVLDEADRMLDLGFEPAIRAIAGAVRSDRHTLMFSATWPVSVRALAAEFMCAPAMVRVGAEGTRAAQSITQVVEVLESEARDGRLEQVLLQHLGSKQSPRRCLVFVLYKKEATRVNDWLRRRGWRCCEIQGDMPQKARTDAVAAFKSGATPMLVATDVAARGLDIPGVELVLNYSFPLTIEDYVHRVGRTGRAGATGCAHTFFCNQDKAHAGELTNVLRETGQPVPPELLRFGTHVKKKESALYGAHYKDLGPQSAKAQRTTFDADD